jgi:ribonuclease HI
MTFDWILYGDGACSGNPGPGGWGSVFFYLPDTTIQNSNHFPFQNVAEFGQHIDQTTNNRMEILALLDGLTAAQKLMSQQKSTLYGKGLILSDSVYVLKGITSWIFGWKKRGWTTAEGAPVSNKDLWLEFDEKIKHLKKTCQLTWRYVPGHKNIQGNERCDEIAVLYSKKQKVPLFQGPCTHYLLHLQNFSEKNFDQNLFQIPVEHPIPLSKAKNDKTNLKAYYLSLIDGQLIRHDNWAECEMRVKGRSGAKFKKVVSNEEEKNILSQWGIKNEDS